jgi:Ni/Co efflux regulator RcnB
VPQPVLLQLGTPPAGYRYVRVANDILLMAIGSRMVVDAITNLGMF